MIHELSLELQFGNFAGPAAPPGGADARRVRRWVGMALNAPADLTVRIVGETEGRALNLQYRGKDYATMC